MEWYDFYKEDFEWNPVVEEILLVSKIDTASIHTAKMKELECWKRNSVFSEVDNEGQPLVSCRWIITSKEKNGVNTTKARLVARGFEDVEVDNQRKDSPTCTKESI